MITVPKEVIIDEIELLRRLVPLAGARVVELGCGSADLARRMLERQLVASMTAFEVDEVQHSRNLADLHPGGLHFMVGSAEDIPLPDASCDVVIMLKSLHHVPMPRLGRAFAEIQRVLVSGGYLYVSEPVYAGDFNEIVRLFHDEGGVRAAPDGPQDRAIASGLLTHVEETIFSTPLTFRDFDDFFDRIVRVTHSTLILEGATLAEVRRRFNRFVTPEGARFVRDMRVNVLGRP
jgi:SAM-dependent methyltransferase